MLINNNNNNHTPPAAGCETFKIRLNVELYVNAPFRDEAEVYAMKYIRRALSLLHKEGFQIDVVIDPRTMLAKQGRVSIYRPRTA